MIFLVVLDQPIVKLDETAKSGNTGTEPSFSRVTKLDFRLASVSRHGFSKLGIVFNQAS